MDLIDRLRTYAKADDLHPDERATLLEAAAALEAAREDGVMQRFADMLLGVLNDTQDALGFTDEDKLCANGSAEIVAAIRELKERAITTPPSEPVGVGGGAIYQTHDETLGAWFDMDKARWENYDSHLRRVVYAAPQPPAEAQAQGGGEVRHDVEDVLCRAAALAERINYSADHDEAVNVSAELRRLLQKALSVRSGLSLFRHPKWGGATSPPSATVGVRATQEDRGEFCSDTAALAFLHLLGDGNPNVERAVERLRSSLITLAQQPAAVDGEAKTVPTRVHLIGETAVIVGTPERGWDEDAQDAHNCDAMGCATIGPHVLARVPFTDERALAAQPGGAE